MGDPGSALGVALIVGFFHAPALEVTTDPPERSCPDRAEIRRAIDGRLGQAEIGSATSWLVSVASALQADALRLTITDPGGAPRFVRDLHVPGEGCAARASAIAVIVERMFLDIGWTSGAPLPPPLEVAEEPPAVRVTTIAQAAAPLSPPSSPGVAPPARPRAAISLGPSVVAGGSPLLGGGIDLQVRVKAPFEATLGTVWPPGARAEAVVDGSARMESVPVRACFRYAARRGRVGIYAGPCAIVSFEEAQTSGISQPGSNRRVTLALGANAGADLRLAARLFLAVEGGGHSTVLGSPFLVGTVGEVLKPMTFQGIFSIRVGVVLWP